MTIIQLFKGKILSLQEKKQPYLFLIFLIFSSLVTQAQVTIKGKVLDDRSGIPVSGALVKVKSTTNAAQADFDGKFELTVNKPLPITLLISFLGYKTQEIDVYESGEDITISLSESQNILDEIVVTGVAQGTTRKGLSFALTKVDNNLINTVPATDASTTLRGKVAGLRIDQSEGNQGATVYLRGAKSVSGNIKPLIVVDGFVTALSLSDINPGDIETIEVVKGAAASALYGTRGEGGVIQVITKKGKGEKFSVVLDNELGFNSVLRTPATSKYHHFKVNGDNSFALTAGKRTIDYQDNGYSVNLHPYKDYYNNVDNVLGTRVFYSNAVSLSASGDKYNFYVSFQNQSKGGISDAIDSDTRRSFLSNLGYKLTDKLEVELTTQYNVDDTPSYATSDGSNGLLYATQLVEPFVNLKQKDAAGYYMLAPDGADLLSTILVNPLYELTVREYKYKTQNLLIGGKAKYKLTEQLSAEASYSIQKQFYNTEDYYPIGYETPSKDVTKNNGYYGKSTRNISAKNGQVQVNYNKTFGNLDFGAAVKSVYESTELDGFSANGYNLTAPVKSLDVTEASTRTIDSEWEKTVNYGHFLNVKAGWKDKLFIDLLGRLDKSSRFGSDVGWAFFPRAAVAYRLTEDLKLDPVTELKLRVAYGQAGSLPPFGAKDSKVTLTSSGGVSYTQNDNTDLKRAITEETEIGFDAIIANILNVQFNYAFSKSKHDFIEVPSFAPLSGSATIYDNLGKVKSNSVELEISGRVIDRKNFSWDTGVTFSRVRSKITSLGDVPEFTDGDYRRAAGLSTSAIWGYSIFTDLSQLETNNEGYVTNAGDGTKRVNDYVVNNVGIVVEKSKLGTKDEAPVFYVNSATGNTKKIGDAQPDFLVGFSNTFTYGPFSLYAVIDWKQGGDKYNETVQYLTYLYRSEFSDQTARMGYPLNFTTQVFNAQLPTDYWVESSGYVALRELALSYQIPVKKLGVNKLVRNARFSLIGRNLVQLTNFKGVNVDGEGYSSARSGDFFNYPTYRTISAKLTIQF
ncbi:TonB-linked SusC/RagA family outer membrane protein [Dysgonomonas sp. PFB1-18]|uniref:SusC/RagA family TonB-linked outer membrane protein n=1 Tax=unclassified Dysgonomonas TaxID=2630389 RepID=UPI0024751887|nr:MULTISPECIES: SusC/RagA family TonB-linked outer membrane protein [unclassified Dysgonomonas]MDH6310453.1 TonB-linked SusC/RagA family outer membrane protein [Dysgonomonas sp. PF1-14]MDH6340764.1 TonB-linked SusC/RagA family outer membrane protein [Dysgonomonas sp. PF1-16]MDH6382384.1 TonB-linked SusC/RagA family outer membrane protein [Dysgonomonas sp. PFB1-18]MDH6399715.1 TonB-linked SusC/RagA family outer membrane protein [Dysgonomonas sp. PF1-23]